MKSVKDLYKLKFLMEPKPAVNHRKMTATQILVPAEITDAGRDDDDAGQGAQEKILLHYWLQILKKCELIRHPF